MDERSGRKAAIQRGVAVIGVIGILDEAASLGLIHLPDVIAQLQQTNFRISSQILEGLLQKYL
ncbi:MAG: DUF3368 domain-containing protein [Microcoleaceae cyanobacterium]